MDVVCFSFYCTTVHDKQHHIPKIQSMKINPIDGMILIFIVLLMTRAQYTKEVFRIRKSKSDRQNNGQKKKDKMTNKGPRNLYI